MATAPTNIFKKTSGRNDHDLKPTFPGYEHINRYWDKNMNNHVAKLLPGEYYVTANHELITTVLGSCISACIRDKLFGIGGMNHFMLPQKRAHSSEQWGNSDVSDGARYGNVAMEHLINGILANGGQKKNLEIKIFGGGKIISNMTDVGANNIKFIHEYIHIEQLNLVAEDVGDIYPRKIMYDPKTGKIKMKKLRSLHNDTIISRETSYMHEIEAQPVAGEIDLF